MRVAYLHPNPRPARPELDAAVRGALVLAGHFPGPMEHLYPGQRLRRIVPRWLCGVGRRRELRRLDAEVDLHLLFSDQLRPYPFLAGLRKPLVYSMMTSFPSSRLPILRPRPRADHWLVVPTDEDGALLEARGYRATVIGPPGLDLSRFTRHPAPQGGEFVVMAGSAPWTRRQFRTKGVDLWLSAVQAMPELRLILLWRGVLEEEIADRIRHYGLAQRVELVNETVDVDRILARSHAATVLAASPKLVKTFPHSLLEALAAGRPVIVSRALGMAEFVEQQGCGEVVETLRLECLLTAVRRLKNDYEKRRAAALTAPLERFSLDEYLGAYRGIFERLLAEDRG